MPFNRSVENRYTPEQKTAYKLFYFCLSIVVVGTVVLITSIKYSENNVVKEVIGVILVLLGASLCYFMCVQIRKSAEIPKPRDSQSCNNHLIIPDQEEGLAYLIVDSSGKLILHPLSNSISLSQRPTGEPPLLVMSSPRRDTGTINCQNLASSSHSVAVPWPLSMNRRRQLAQMSSSCRESNRNSASATQQTRNHLPIDPPPYSVGEASAVYTPSSNATINIPQPVESPPPYEDIVRQPSSSRS